MSFPPLNVTVLGSGTSHGVPVIACSCAVCRSDDPRDKRTRSSIYVDDGVFPFVVDTTPEFRLQCLAQNVTRLEGALFTHAHADHVFGFDDLRCFCDRRPGRLPVHGSPATLAMLGNVYGYAFDPAQQHPAYIRATAVPFETLRPFPLGTLSVIPLEVVHGRAVCHGFLFEREGRKLLGYIPDAKTLPDATRERLRGVEVLILDGLRDQEHPTHMTTAQAVAAGEEVGAGTTIVTHLTHHKSHAEREAELPPGYRVAYDGLTLAL